MVTRDHNCGQSIMARSPRIGAPPPPGSQNPWPEVSFMMWVAIASCNSSETREKASRHISHTSWASPQSHMLHIGPAHPSTVSKAHRTWLTAYIPIPFGLFLLSVIHLVHFPLFLFSMSLFHNSGEASLLPSFLSENVPLPLLPPPYSQLSDNSGASPPFTNTTLASLFAHRALLSQYIISSISASVHHH